MDSQRQISKLAMTHSRGAPLSGTSIRTQFGRTYRYHVVIVVVLYGRSTGLLDLDEYVGALKVRD